VKNRILPRQDLALELEAVRKQGHKIVFTNGCFDLLHVGHLRYLAEARAKGDCLVVAINTDASVQSIKGPNRPILPQEERAEILAALEMVDYVTFFDEPTPQEIIELLQPDVLVKGADWPIDQIVGREVVWARGGQVVNIPVVEGLSTSETIARILS
jgi:D-beta-D-heptose 7-phosphate kinase/D-beta-D-heptose 1-phosphate adenosyltransferase